MFQQYLSSCLVCVTLFVVGNCYAQEPKFESAAELRKLVGELESPNQRPDIGELGEFVKLPDNYDLEAQNKINAAREALNSHIEEALPYLVEGLGSKKYSMTIRTGESGAYKNYSVGDVCLDIITSNIEVYRHQISYENGTHWERHNFPFSKDWWGLRKNKKLWELQLEAVDWAIKMRKSDPNMFKLSRREEDLANLNLLRGSIEASKKAQEGMRLVPMVKRSGNRCST